MNLPNKLTLLRVILIPVYVWVFFMDIKYASFIAGAIFIIATLTDFLDGAIARKYNLVSNFGKFADPLADKILVLTCLFCFVQILRIPAWMCIIIMARELAVTSLRTLAALDGKVVAADKFGKAKTLFQMNALVIMHFDSLSPLLVNLSNILFYISIALTIISGINYFVLNKEVISFD